jgi:TP901 family phage tail tape measure protein
MSVESLSLLISAIDEASAPIAKIADQIENLEKTGRNLKDLGGNITDLGKGMTARVTAPIVAGLGAAAYTAIQFESAMADVNKIFGESEVQAAGLDKQILAMSRNIPISAEGLASIAAAGGQLGVPMDQIGEFTELAAQLGTAFDMSADTAGRSIAKLQTALNLDGLDEVREVGDIFNHLSDNSGAAASEMVDVATRIGGVANTFGLATNEVGALAASFIEMAPSPEIAATGINSMLSTLQTIEGATPRARAAMDTIGISATDMAEMIANDPMDAIQGFLGALGEVDSTARAGIIRDIFGTGSDSTLINQLAGNTGILADNLALVANQADYAGSATREFQSRSATTANAIQLMGNRMKEIGINVGSVMLPAINDVLGALAPMAERFADFASNNPGLVRIGVIFAGIVAAIGPVLIIIGQVISAVGALASVWATVQAAVLAFSGVLAGIGAVSLGPILAVIAAIAAAAFLIITNWGPIKEFFISLGQQIMQAFAPLVPKIQEMWMALMQAGQAIFQFGMKLFQIGMGIANAIAQFFGFNSAVALARAAVVGIVMAIAQFIASLIRTGVAAVTAAARLVAAFTNGASQVITVVSNMGQQIISALRSVASSAFAAGKAIISRVADGIRAGIGAVKDAASSVASAIAGLLPGSPVRYGPLTVLNNTANNPGAGIAKMIAAGITAGAPAVNAAMAGLGGQALGFSASPQVSPLESGGGSGSGGAPQITINISGVSNQSEAQGVVDVFEDRVRRVLDDYERNQARVAY